MTIALHFLRLLMDRRVSPPDSDGPDFLQTGAARLSEDLEIGSRTRRDAPKEMPDVWINNEDQQPNVPIPKAAPAIWAMISGEPPFG